MRHHTWDHGTVHDGVAVFNPHYGAPAAAAVLVAAGVGAVHCVRARACVGRTAALAAAAASAPPRGLSLVWLLCAGRIIRAAEDCIALHAVVVQQCSQQCTQRARTPCAGSLAGRCQVCDILPFMWYAVGSPLVGCGMRGHVQQCGVRRLAKVCARRSSQTWRCIGGSGVAWRLFVPFVNVLSCHSTVAPGRKNEPQSESHSV